MNKLDAIICTYNRPNLICDFVNQLLNTSPKPNNIIVVDSSDSENKKLKLNKKIIYLKSKIKSQPYQRFLGAKKSDANICVFFDDDLEILKQDLFSVIESGFNLKNIVGVGLGIDYHVDNRINKNKKNPNVYKGTFNYGKISWLGRTTPLPKFNTTVSYFNGPIMAFKKSIVFKLFDKKLFENFEKRIMMGEDKIISMRASKYGDLYYFGDKNYLRHPPIKSTYFNNVISFTAKVTFSRFELSKVYSKTNNKKIYLAYIYFTCYFIKRLIYDSNNFEKLKGHFLALSYFFSQKKKKIFESK